MCLMIGKLALEKFKQPLKLKSFFNRLNVLLRREIIDDDAGCGDGFAV
jgi:hypothetical protein